MGNIKFRLSDMIPNAWFYKLKDMSKTRKHNTNSPKKKPPSSSFPPPQRTHLSQTKYSYYITEDHQQPKRDERLILNLQEQPRRSSSTKRSRRKAVYKPSPKKHVTSSSVSSSHCSCHPSSPESPGYFDSSSSERISTEDHEFHELISSEFESQAKGTSNSDSCKKVDDESNKLHVRFELPPILTKPMSKSSTPPKLKETKLQNSHSSKIIKQERSSSANQNMKSPLFRNSFASPNGIRIRSNSPRLASKKLQQTIGSRNSVTKNRGGISDSFAVVKSSLDPQKDFKDSMKEMIMENNIKDSKDLEELLACYLSLNSRVYHDHIVKAFEQIWFDMPHIKI